MREQLSHLGLSQIGATMNYSGVSPSGALSSLQRQRGTIHVLLVEDYEDLRETILDVLETFGYRVTPVEDIQQALDVRAVPDVLICDTDLPDGTGWELLERLRRRPEWARVPAIALSGRQGGAEPLRTERSGFLRHLIKPISIHDLDRTILELTHAVPADEVAARSNGCAKRP